MAKKYTGTMSILSFSVRGKIEIILATRNCHVVTKNFGLVTSWHRHKKVNFRPCSLFSVNTLGRYSPSAALMLG